MAIEERLDAIIELLQEKSHLAEIADSLRRIAAELAIIRSQQAPLAGHRVATVVNKNVMKSVAMDGTVQEAELP